MGLFHFNIYYLQCCLNVVTMVTCVGNQMISTLFIILFTLEISRLHMELFNLMSTHCGGRGGGEKQIVCQLRKLEAGIDRVASQVSASPRDFSNVLF